MLKKTVISGRDLTIGGHSLKPRSKKDRKLTVIILFITVLIPGLLTLKNKWQVLVDYLQEPDEYRLIKPIAEEKSLNEFLGTTEVKLNNREDLVNLIQSQISNQQGRYGIYFKDFDSEYEMNIQGDEIFDAASVVKIVPMVIFYQLVEQKKKSLNDEYRLQSTDIQNYGSGSMRYDSPGTTYTFKKLLDLSGKQSDNTADYVLRQAVGNDEVAKFLEREKMVNTNLETVQSTPREVANLLIRIYKGKVLTKQYEDLLYDNLTKTMFEDRISMGIPQPIRVVHKIGNGINRSYNDCGLVLGPHPFVLCIMNQDASESEAMAAIPKIARIVFEWSMKQDKK